MERFVQGTLVTLDASGTILKVRQGSEVFLRPEPRTELEGTKLSCLLPGDQAKKVDDMIRVALRSGAPIPGSMTVTDSNGQLCEVHCKAARTNFPERHILLQMQLRENQFVALNKEIAALGHEIARRRDVEADLRDTKERLELILGSTPEGVFGIDLEGHITFCNASTLRALQYEAEHQLIGRCLSKTAQHRWQDGSPRSIGESLLRTPSVSSQSPHGKRDILIRKDGSALPIEFRLRPLARDGEQLGTVCTFTDITDQLLEEERQRQFNHKVQQAQKLESLGVLAGGIAHDFNNLLLGIIGNIDLALLDATKPTMSSSYLGDAMGSAQRAAELCKQMLAYSGKGRFVVVPLDLSVLVEDMADLLKVSISKKVGLHYGFTSELPAIEVDATQVRQIVMNLIINASDAIGDSVGSISISTGEMLCDSEYLSESYLDEELPPGNYVYLEVSDSGEGMTRDTISRIFEPFFSTKETGRGLGLAAVLGIVRGHKGALKIYSEPGSGTTMKVLFPSTDLAPQSEVSATSNAEDWNASGTILVVDDEASIRVLASRILGKAGFHILFACDGEEAVRVYKEQGPEIRAVLLDMTMPKLNGEQTYRQLRQMDPDVMVVLTSGYNEQDAISRFAGKGLAGFIQKPYRSAQLLDVFRECMTPAAPGASPKPGQ